MRIEPIDWNVVVLGFWNRAILTPAGIGRRLFHVEEGTPLQVEIPLEGLAPQRVRHEGLIVTAESGRLVVAQSSRGGVRLRYASKHPQPADQGTRAD